MHFCRSRNKRVLLSLGGEGNQYQYLEDDAAGVRFADILVGAFGKPGVVPDYQGPRPFGSAWVDGFDFDVESYEWQIPQGKMYVTTLLPHLPSTMSFSHPYPH